jgi:hypothetical protein
VKITDLSLDQINSALSFTHETEQIEADWSKALDEDEAQLAEPEFDWAPILAAEAAKQAAFEASTEVGGFLVRDLRVAFDAVSNKENWKLPVSAAIRAEDRAITAVAIEFFTGSKTRFGQLPNGKLLAEAPGYYTDTGA